MGTRFCFFTDPALLNAQTSGEAFGPITPSVGPKDQFRVTDLHTSSSAAPVFAVCDGVVCAQKDAQGGGTLTLILKPAHQPPFDFPAVSYFLYKGVDPSSILTLDGEHIDTSQAAGNDLIQTIKTAWELSDNNHPAGSVPTKACLGLHLTVTDYPATEPLDRFFFEGDPTIQLPVVRAGHRLGTFSSPFGLEIVIERINHRPKIKLARTVESLVEVDTLAGGADETAAFLHWDAKEEILGFIDPCAFWASFFVSTLSVRNSGTNTSETIDGDDIYTQVVHGSSGSFVNRNRAYLDIRNEHGCSLNYYRADGPEIHLTLDPTLDMDTAAAATVNYYASGWPSFAIDDTFLPTGTSDVQIDVRFALPKTVNTLPLIYIAAGFRGGFDSLKDSQRFLEPPRRADSDYLEEASITIPLADDGNGTHIAGSYHKLYCFKRPLCVKAEPNPSPNATDLSPTYANDLDAVIPLLNPNDLPSNGASMTLKTYCEAFYVGSSAAGGPGFVANAAVGVDSNNVVVMLVPRARLGPTNQKSSAPLTFPSLSFPSEGASIYDYLSCLLPSPLLMRRVTDPHAASNEIDLVRFQTTLCSDLQAEASPPLIILGLSRTEMSQLHTTVTSLTTHGPQMLSLTRGTTRFEGSHSHTEYDLELTVISGPTAPARAIQSIAPALYVDDS